MASTIQPVRVLVPENDSPEAARVAMSEAVRRASQLSIVDVFVIVPTMRNWRNSSAGWSLGKDAAASMEKAPLTLSNALRLHATAPQAHNYRSMIRAAVVGTADDDLLTKVESDHKLAVLVVHPARKPQQRSRDSDNHGFGRLTTRLFQIRRFEPDFEEQTTSLAAMRCVAEHPRSTGESRLFGPQRNSRALVGRGRLPR